MQLQQAIEALRKGDVAEFQGLLETDPTLIKARDESGVSLLMMACYHRRPEFVDLLLDDPGSLDVFEAAAIGNKKRLAELCHEHPEMVHAWSSDGFQPLHLTSFFAHPDCVELLLEQGADADSPARNPSSVRPIHSAVAGRDHQVIQLLVDKGAELNVRQHGGWTPLHSTAMHGDSHLVRLFVAHGADPAAKSDDGKTPADLAAASGHNQIVTILNG